MLSVANKKRIQHGRVAATATL